jgi:hypothetical protein
LPPCTSWVAPGLGLAGFHGVSGCERWFLSFLGGTWVNGQPSPNDVAKAASSDGIGPHAHGDSGLHSHGEPSFTDDEVELLEGNGWHVDRHHNRVSDENGFTLSPATVGAMLRDLRGLRAAEDDDGAVGTTTTKMSSAGEVGGMAPGEVAQVAESPVVAYLDLR